MSDTIRTRFAPSPTGFMHVGGIRTALFAWLAARQGGGQFILRIEDTDKAREVPGSVEQIMESMRWLGLDWDEGPDTDGPFGPYTQSQRIELYTDMAKLLSTKGHVYADPYTPEQVEEFRKQAQAEKRPFLFRDHRPESPEPWSPDKPLRFRVPELKSYRWQDEVRGELTAGEEALDDFIILKSDGFPTYNFAHVVDDHLMEITHVIRGEEFIASTPKFLSLYDAFGWESPKLVTLPPVLGASGGKKLSKREGAQSALDYRDQGYLPEALFNFLASLGWNDGTEQEVFSRDEIMAKFTINRIQKSGARFDGDRLDWMNGQHIRRLTTEQLAERVEAFWPVEASTFDEAYKLKVLALVHERLKFFAELPELTRFFFVDPEPKAGEPAHIEAALAELEASDFTEPDLEERLRALAEKLDVKPGKLFGALRVAVTGQEVAPGLFETMATLGKEAVLRRLKAAL